MTNFLDYRNQDFYIEQVAAKDLAKQFGTPVYVYSAGQIYQNLQTFNNVFNKKHYQICYAVKANANLNILHKLAAKNVAFDTVSEGELRRVLQVCKDLSRTVFSGVGKKIGEIDFALQNNVQSIHAESESELAIIAARAESLQIVANVCLRVNPNIDAHTHPYISTGLSENKFGIDIQAAEPIYQKYANNHWLNLYGVSCHIGSQISQPEPFIQTIDSLAHFLNKLSISGINLSTVDIGGGFAVDYENLQGVDQSLLQTIADKIEQTFSADIKILLEPGRSLVANAGVLLAEAIYLKNNGKKSFCIIDAAMNDLIRPALYKAYHPIVNCRQHSEIPAKIYDIVGPVCESGDFLAKDRQLAVQQYDLLAVLMSGAYSFGLSSNYNSRRRAAEVLVENDQAKLIRPRESWEDLMQSELNF